VPSATVYPAPGGGTGRVEAPRQARRARADPGRADHRPDPDGRRGRRRCVGLVGERRVDRAPSHRPPFPLRAPRPRLRAGRPPGRHRTPYLPTPTSLLGFGGTARADAAAKADLWRRILAFLAGEDQRRRG
jgi:hypothetical protein